jgi:hypothetical protein
LVARECGQGGVAVHWDFGDGRACHRADRRSLRGRARRYSAPLASTCTRCSIPMRERTGADCARCAAVIAGQRFVRACCTRRDRRHRECGRASFGWPQTLRWVDEHRQLCIRLHSTQALCALSNVPRYTHALRPTTIERSSRSLSLFVHGTRPCDRRPDARSRGFGIANLSG